MGGPGSGKIKKPKIKKLIREIVPVESIFNDEEAQMYDEFILAYISDFDEEELSSSDLDDITNLAMNKVLAYRLLQKSKDDINMQLDVANSLEKLDKRNEKLKESLSSRRRDRIDPNELKGFSIVDLVSAYDQEQRDKHRARLEKMRKEEEKTLEKRKDYHGNRYDKEGVSEETQ
jgi:hypothetical protein